MSLPFYHTITLKSASFDDLNSVLSQELNLKHPAVINMRSLNADEQRELIGLIENHFVTNGISYKFPYPIYVVTEHEATISGLSLVKRTEDLPKFFVHREGKMNVKESHLAGKNKLLQQEVRNGDAASNETEIKVYGKIHRQIFLCEEERRFYRMLIAKLMKAKNG